MTELTQFEVVDITDKVYNPMRGEVVKCAVILDIMQSNSGGYYIWLEIFGIDEYGKEKTLWVASAAFDQIRKREQQDT